MSMLVVVRFEARARVAGRDEDLRHAGRLRNFPGERVFAPPDPMISTLHVGLRPARRPAGTR
jgi:hypothetical protein